MDDKKEKIEEVVPAATEQEDAEVTETSDPGSESRATLLDDYAMLERINILKAVMIRMKGGRHPSDQIESLLKRRMNFSGEDFQGPYVVRLVSTLMMIFIFSALLWAFLWILASGFGLNYFIKILSTGMATVVAAIAGVALFHPSSLPDEEQLKKAIEQRLKEIQAEVRELNGEEEIEEKQRSSLIDANFEETAPETKLNKVQEQEAVLTSMPEGLDAIKPGEQFGDGAASDSSDHEKSIDFNKTANETKEEKSES